MRGEHSCSDNLAEHGYGRAGSRCAVAARFEANRGFIDPVSLALKQASAYADQIRQYGVPVTIIRRGTIYNERWSTPAASLASAKQGRYYPLAGFMRVMAGFCVRLALRTARMFQYWRDDLVFSAAFGCLAG